MAGFSLHPAKHHIWQPCFLPSEMHRKANDRINETRAKKGKRRTGKEDEGGRKRKQEPQTKQQADSDVSRKFHAFAV